MDKNKFTLDLTKKDSMFEIASTYDSDLMQILCYATHEGENFNRTIFPPLVLFNRYATFIDKPVVIVPDSFNNPTGHGFDFKNKTFDNKKRVQIGHITDSYPVVVKDDGAYRVWDIGELDREDLKDGELRIVTEIAIYKHYFSDIAERLKELHEMGNLKFSMEALVDCYQTEDGGRVCTDINFTGLAVVDKPAFARAHSIEVASQKEEEDMEFKEMYEAEKAKNETLIAEKALADEELEKAKTELASIKEELANSKAEVANANAEIETLKPYKEKVEIAEKEQLGKERAAKLAKFGVKEVNETELAEKSIEEFADMLVEAAEQMKVEVAEQKGLDGSVLGLPQHNTGMKSNKDELLKLLGLSK